MPHTARHTFGDMVGPTTASPEGEGSGLDEIREFLGRTEVRAGLLQFAIGALQPLGPGDSPLGALARAGASGLEAAGRVGEARTAAEEKAFKRERTLRAEELEGEKLTAAEERQRISAGATTEAAGTRAEATIGAAEIGAVSRGEVAGTGAEATLEAARIRVEGARELAEVKAARPRVLTTADSGEIRRQVVQSLGGFLNPVTLEAQGLTPQTVQQAATLQAEAERILKSDKVLSVGQAVVKARENMGLGGIATPVGPGVSGAEIPSAPVSLTKEDRQEISAQNVLIRNALIQVPGLVEAVAGEGGAFPAAGTGILSMGAAALDQTIGQLVAAFGAEDPTLFQDTQDNRNKLRQFILTVKNVLTKNKRFIVGEQLGESGVLDFLDTFNPNTFFANPSTGARNMVNTLEFLRLQLSTNETLTGAPAAVGFDTVVQVNEATIEALQDFAIGLSPEGIAALPDDVKAAMATRFREAAKFAREAE